MNSLAHNNRMNLIRRADALFSSDAERYLLIMKWMKWSDYGYLLPALHH
jgi:hypothetical protein